MKHKILLLPLVTMLISGVSVYTNAQLVKGMDPILQTTIKNGLVGIMLIVSMLATKKLAKLGTLTQSQWLKLVVVALVGGSLSFALFFTGLKTAGAVEGALVHKTMVLWIALISLPLLKQKLSPWMLLGIIGLYASNFIGGASFKSFNPAQAMVLAATLLWSIEAILVHKYLKKIDPDLLLFGRMGLGSGILLAYVAATGKLNLISTISFTQWQGLVLVSILLFGYVMTWYRSLKYLSPVLVSAILVGSTVITTTISTTVAGNITTPQLIQALIISGLVSLIVVFANRNLTKPTVQLNRSI